MATPTLPEANPKSPSSDASFAETVIQLSGKSAEEARRTGAIDKADDQVEGLFGQQFQTAHSPAHRIVWDSRPPLDLFRSKPESTPVDVRSIMDRSLEVVERRKRAGVLFDEHDKVSEGTLSELSEAGYWGLLVDRSYGGAGASFRSFAPFLAKMATIDPTVAGLASVHGCIGAVDPVRTFGTPDQKERFLPRLASGKSLSAFALTEPCAGSDLTALRTTAKLEGDHYVVNGEKLFITNAVPGRTIGLVCLIDEKPAVLIADLPEQENEHFQIRKYGLHALKKTWNRGLIFKDFLVPKENLLTLKNGNGLTIAYHGLNLGRVALCANAAGTMRILLASMLPWATFRKTYGEEIAKRELVRRRVGRMAGLIVACDALVAWCSSLLDQGYRGELECIVAKVFGSEALKESAVEFCMKTHGGRSFIHGHLFGDNVHEYLAPCIYEGEGEMLGMAFFKSLVKQHGVTFFEPVGKALHANGLKTLNPLNPVHVWKLRSALVPYAKWMLSESFKSVSMPAARLPQPLLDHAKFAYEFLQRGPSEISATLRKHQLKLADRQCRMSELSSRYQKALVILVTSLYAADSSDETTRMAADIACQDLTREITSKRASDRYYREVCKLGEKVASGWSELKGVEAPELLMKYETA